MPDGIFNIGLTEAEDLLLTGGYAIQTAGAASGGQIIQLAFPSNNGVATGTFNGVDGTYEVGINYLNENDGVATWTVLVNGVSVGSFQGTGGGTGPNGLGAPATENFTLTLEDGDTIAIEGQAGDGERARLDSVEIRQLGALNIGSNEAEDLNVSGGYSVENLPGASGGQAVVLPVAPGLATGTVGGEFNGPTGAYDVAVTFFNESDGVGSYQLLVNNVVVGSWTGEGGASGLGAPDTRTFTVNLDPGDVVSVQGTRGDGERGRIDVIDITEAATIGIGTTEAEDLSLSNYDVEANSGASGGERVRTDGVGTASGIFTGGDGTYSLTVNYIDENDGNSPFVVFVNGVEQGSFVANADIGPGAPASETFTLNLNQGDIIAVQGTRNAAEFARLDSLELSVINNAPTTVDDTRTIDEDTSVTIDVLANDNDAQNDPITLTEINGNSVIIGETVSVGEADVSIDANGVLTVTPIPEFSGNVSFTYTASDGSVSSQGNVTVTVEAVNDTPVAQDDTGSTIEDGSVVISVLANDSDPENSALTVTAIAGSPVTEGTSVDIGNGTATLGSNGNITVSPDTNFSGVLSFAYTVSDGDATSDATVTVSVGSVNDGLTANDDTASINEDSSINLDVLDNDVDPDGDPITLTQIDGSNVEAGDSVDVGTATVTLEANGTLTIDPDANFDGDVAFTYTISDGDLTDQADVTVSINGLNDIPVANDDTGTVAEDSSGSVDVLANDEDADGDELSVSAIAGQAVIAGTTVDVGNALVTLESNGTLTVAPDADFTGDLSFGYAVTDGITGDNGTVSITVTNVNDAPSAADDAASTSEDAAVDVDVVANDSDPENDSLQVSAIAGTAVAVGGSVDVANATVTLNGNGTLSVVPDTGFDGVLTFSYTVSDGSLTDNGSVSVTVEGVIDDPTNGNDIINGTLGDNTINGLDGDDEIFGGSGDDTLSGDDGDDLVAGGGGRDLVSGGAGNDDLRGGKGSDTLIGGDGNDRLRVGGDDDFGFGGNGDDFLQGAAGNDTLNGDNGNDTLFGGTGVDTLNGGDGDDELRAGSSDDRLDGGDGNDTLLSQSGDDIADGGAGDDLVNGAAGNDTLLGGAGNDTLNGGSGNDTLEGGAGDDLLNGQAGMDTFVFDADEGGSDTVRGYEDGETILLRDFGYTTAEAASADFTQVGDDVVFTNGDSTVTFVDTTLFNLFEGIAVEETSAGSASVEVSRADAPDVDVEAMFDASLIDDAALF
ncbi:MAG: Ig-like domain-containing protein [Pseudomonadota bacterium]